MLTTPDRLLPAPGPIPRFPPCPSLTEHTQVPLLPLLRAFILEIIVVQSSFVPLRCKSFKNLLASFIAQDGLS